MPNIETNASLIAASSGMNTANAQEAELIAVLKANSSRKEKADACRLLARCGTKNAIAPLVAMLGNEEDAHMARYGLETIPDNAVDEALRDALGTLKGRLLTGVIGSLGVRRDGKAVRPLTKLLNNSDSLVAQAAARALGSIGSAAAAKALDKALGRVSKENQLAFCEGLFRCAEALAKEGRKRSARAAYDRLRKVDGPHQVRAGALRGAVLTRKGSGLKLLQEALRGDDFVLVDAADRTAQEMPGTDVIETLANELDDLCCPNKQIVVIQTLGMRGNKKAVPALKAAAKSDSADVRDAAKRALGEIAAAKS